jgi:hypothetical protein
MFDCAVIYALKSLLKIALANGLDMRAAAIERSLDGDWDPARSDSPHSPNPRTRFSSTLKMEAAYSSETSQRSTKIHDVTFQNTVTLKFFAVYA